MQRQKKQSPPGLTAPKKKSRLRKKKERTDEGGSEEQNGSDALRVYLKSLPEYHALTSEEERELSIRIATNKKDVKARQELASSSLRLVVKIAREYFFRNSYPILDLIQEGNVGLMHAVEKFNPDKGSKFSNYSTRWIRAYIMKYIMDNWSLVKFGTTQCERKAFYRLNKAKEEIRRQGKEPTVERLAEKLGIKEKNVSYINERLSSPDVSINEPLHEEGRDTIEDTITSGFNLEEYVVMKVESEEIRRKIEEFRGSLNDSDVEIFDRRILKEEDPWTLEQLGGLLNISRERVRQRETGVFRKAKEFFVNVCL